MHTFGSHRTTTWHFGNDTTDLARTLAHTLSVQDSVADDATSFIDGALDFHDLRAAATYRDDGNEVYGACWHRGAHYDYVVAGDPAFVIQYCDLTSGEREIITLTSRRLSGSAGKTYAVATGSYKKLHPSLSELHKTERLTVCGLVASA